MKRKLALILVISLTATLFVFSLAGCDQTEEYEARESFLSDRATAVEADYVIAEETIVKFGKDVVYPVMTEMTNLEKSRHVNGALSTRGIKIGSDTDGNPGMVFSSYDILIQNKDILSIKFYANEKMNAQDETMNFLFAATKDGKLFMNAVNIFDNVENNTKVNDLFAVFNTYRVEQGMEEVDMNGFDFSIVAFAGEDSQNMDIIFSYLREQQNQVVIPFSEVSAFLSDEYAEFFAFAK